MLPPIYAVLKAAAQVASIVQTRIFRHGNAPQGTTRPYVSWVLVAGTPANQLSGTPGHDRCTVQLDCWALTDREVEDLAVAVRAAMEPVAHLTSVIVNEREPETKLYRIALQFDYWLPRAALAASSSS